MLTTGRQLTSYGHCFDEHLSSEDSDKVPRYEINTFGWVDDQSEQGLFEFQNSPISSNGLVDDIYKFYNDKNKLSKGVSQQQTDVSPSICKNYLNHHLILI